MSSSVRQQSTLVLVEVMTHSKSLAAVIPKFNADLSDKDQALLQELCFGVCRHLHRIQHIVKRLVAKPLKTKDHDILALIYLGIYQLLYTRIPDHAAIGATVDVALHLKKPWAKAMLNGVLRNVQRQQESFDAQWQDDPTYRYSHPKWFVQALRGAWPNAWPAILEANNAHPPFTLRVNQQHISRDHYLLQLEERQLPATATPHSPFGITLLTPVKVTQLPHFSDGYVSVQDEAAQLAAPLLDVQPGNRVLDACCAPGGKTCHILEAQPQLGQLVALDHDADRMTRVAENLQRLGLTAMLITGDASEPTSWWDGIAFDRILLDAPCSATGVIRRHPDIKLLRRASDIDKLAELQGQILAALWQTLKPGGRLVYATCSALPQENEQVVAAFIAATEDAEHIAIDAQWGIERPFGRQLFATQDGHDGFYYAAIHKRA